MYLLIYHHLNLNIFSYFLYYLLLNFSTINDDIQMKDVSQYKQSIRRKRKYYETFNSSLPDKLSNFNLCK